MQRIVSRFPKGANLARRRWHRRAEPSHAGCERAARTFCTGTDCAFCLCLRRRPSRRVCRLSSPCTIWFPSYRPPLRLPCAPCSSARVFVVSVSAAAQTSRYLFLQAAGYTFARVEYKPLQLWTFSIGDLLNCVDASNIWVTKVQYSLSENIDVTGETDIPLGRSGGEFSTQAYNFSGGLSIGVPYQASIGIKATF